MRKKLVLLVAIMVALSVFSGCSKSKEDAVWDWAKNLDLNNIGSAEAWQAAEPENRRNIEEADLVFVVARMNMLTKKDFEQYNGSSEPDSDYGITLHIGQTVYTISCPENDEGQVLMDYNGTKWIINSKELAACIVYSVVSEPLDRSSPSDLIQKTPGVIDEGDPFIPSERIPGYSLLENSEGISALEITSADGRTAVISGEESDELIKLLSEPDAECVPHPHHLESQQSGAKVIINIQYEDGAAETIYSTESGIYYYRYVDTVGSSGDRGYVTMKSTEMYDMIDDILNQ